MTCETMNGETESCIDTCKSSLSLLLYLKILRGNEESHTVEEGSTNPTETTDNDVQSSVVRTLL